VLRNPDVEVASEHLGNRPRSTHAEDDRSLLPSPHTC